MPTSDEMTRYKADQAARYAEHVRELGARLAANQAAVDAIRARLLPGGIAYDSPRVSGGLKSDRVGDGVPRLIEAAERYAADANEWVGELDRFYSCCHHLNGSGAAVLMMHYGKGMPWDKVAEKLCYSQRSVYRIRTDALAALFDFMPSEWRDQMPRAV